MDSDVEYAEFMLHSSEMMPGGSPSFKTEGQIDELYATLEDLFSYAIEIGFEGYTFDSWEKVRNEQVST